MTDFKKIITGFPDQFKTGFELAKDVRIGSFRNVIFCGMGGSIIPAEIFITLISGTGYKTSITRYYIHRSYEIPEWASKEDLVICTSWSGNTKETLSSYVETRKKNIPLIVITKGGKIMELAQKDGTPVVVLPQEDIPPRMGVGYMFSALYAILAANGVIEDESNSIKNLGDKLKPEDFEKKAEQLSKEIFNKTPLIYSSRKRIYLADFWKSFFNETSKIHAFYNTLPGMAHDELAGFNKDDKDKFFAIFLLDKNDNLRYQLSIKNIRSILLDLKYNGEIVFLTGDNDLEKTFNNYLFAAMTSMYLAQMRGVDPAEAKIIEEFKKL